MSVRRVIKPPRLKAGDTVGIVSPSWGGAGQFPHRVELGIAALERLGFKVKLGKHALNQKGFVSDSPANRVSDLHDMFTDPEVRLVLAATGGDHSNHLLPLLDFDLIANNPKLFMGYSDITVLNVAIHSVTGLVTFNGPALLTDFAEYPDMHGYNRDAFIRVTTQAVPFGRLEPAKFFTEERLEWHTKEDLERPRALEPSPGWTWLKGKTAEGALIGGCLESLQHLRGTRYWPDLRGAILFFETSEEKPSPAHVDAMLMDFENMGAFEELQGLLVGRSMGYSPEEKAALRAILLERSRRFDFPIVTDMDFGHTAPQFALPLGCRAAIDVPSERFEILESAVS